MPQLIHVGKEGHKNQNINNAAQLSQILNNEKIFLYYVNLLNDPL